MRYIEINGKKASVIALGTAEYGGTCDERSAYDQLDAYADFGGNYIDTAHVYGDFVTPKNGESERVIGQWLYTKPRDAFFISTKGGHYVLGGASRAGRLSREELRRDMGESLEALKTDCVDIYWLHRDNADLSVGEIMENLQELIEEGRTSLIGASNWSAARIREANAYALSHGLTPFFANQPQLSLAVMGPNADDSLVTCDTETVALHRETQMLMTPYSAQGRGFFTKLDALGEEGINKEVYGSMLTAANLGVYARLKKLSSETGHSIGALALAWLTALDFPVLPIAGVSRVSQLETVKEAGDIQLTSEQAAYLRKL